MRSGAILGEFGQIVPQEPANAARLIAIVEDPENGPPADAIATLKVLVEALTHLETKIGEFDAKITRRANKKDVARRLLTVPRIGPLIATTRMGERSLHRLLIIGANSVIIKRHVHAAAQPGTWLGGMLTRKPPILVRVAPANKMARIFWALMAGGGVC